MKHVFLFLLFANCLLPSALAAVIHVPGDQPSIQTGIDTASAGDTVLIADGTYPLTSQISINSKPLLISVEHAGSVTVDCQDMTGGFLVMGNASFYGLEVINGHGYQGAAIYAYNSVLQVEDCSFRSCDVTAMGGALWVEGTSEISITGCLFSNNSAVDSGGAVSAYGFSSFRIEESIFTDNNAGPYGGAVDLLNYDPGIEIVDCEFTGNSADGGGACRIYASYSNPGYINGCSFNGNSGGSGGALFIQNIPVQGCSFVENFASGSSAVGGAVFSWPETNISDSVFVNNSADDAGGAVSVWNGTIGMVNCLFIGNSSESGGAFGWSDTMGYLDSADIINCTFTENQATTGGGVYFPGIYSELDISSCVLWNNSADNGHEMAFDEAPNPGTCIVHHSDVQGGAGQVYYASGGALTWDPGNISTDPAFTSGPAGAYYLSQTAAGQGSNSPCLNSGSTIASNICFTSMETAVCLNGRTTRTDQVFDDETVDMGYHYPEVTVITMPSMSCAGIGILMGFFTLIYAGFRKRSRKDKSVDYSQIFVRN